ncbi:putative phospholipase A2-like protein 1 [Forsythia ovata]|uniref:Phospholipase A2-like protein 1 n=1 Tax=Forsythia ovata TaxID=205694 RepID=A0ABD1SLE7_9LAMI
MQPGNVVVPQRRCIATTYVVFMCLILITESSNNSQCVTTVRIRYGKYCGVGWTGCLGEDPCDDLDAFCKIHDECVEKNVCLLMLNLNVSNIAFGNAIEGQHNMFGLSDLD